MDLVYLIHADETHRYKIGTTSNSVESRLKELQTGCPFLLRPIKSVVGGKCQEDEVHEKFKEYRKQGEWFEFNGHIKRQVMKYMDTLGDKNCQEYLIEMKSYKDHLIESLHEDSQYKRNLEDLLLLTLMNIELGCWEESVNNLEEYYYHVYGNHTSFYGMIKLNKLLYNPKA